MITILLCAVVRIQSALHGVSCSPKRALDEIQDVTSLVWDPTLLNLYTKMLKKSARGQIRNKHQAQTKGATVSRTLMTGMFPYLCAGLISKMVESNQHVTINLFCNLKLNCAILKLKYTSTFAVTILINHWLGPYDIPTYLSTDIWPRRTSIYRTSIIILYREHDEEQR